MSEKRTKIYKELKKIQAQGNVLKILIIRNGLLGDIVFITSMAAKVMEAFPGAEIDLVLSEASKDILKNFPGINKTFTLKRNSSVWEDVKFFASLRKEKYHLVFVQEVNTHYTIMGKIAGGKFLAGYQNQLDFLLDLAVKREGHAVKAELATILALEGEKYSYSPTKLYVSNSELKEAEKILNNSGLKKDDFLICLHPGCSEKNSVREWTAEGYSELATQLAAEYNAKIVITGTEQDYGIIKNITDLNPEIKSFAGKTNIRTLLGLLSFFKLIIGPDTGVLHIGNALGIPVVMLMGYADPEDTGPYNNNSAVITAKDRINCIPCKFKNPKPELWAYCSVNRPAKCMEMISVEQVLTAANKILTLEK